MLDRRRRTALLAAASATIALSAVGIVAAVSAHAAVGCRVTYAITAQWPGGFTANLNLDNLGDPVNGWALRWTFGSGQAVSQGWNASFTQSGTQVTATNASWNAALATGASTSLGFNGTFTSTNPVPTAFTLNGTACTGTTPPPPRPGRRSRTRPRPHGHRSHLRRRRRHRSRRPPGWSAGPPRTAARPAAAVRR